MTSLSNVMPSASFLMYWGSHSQDCFAMRKRVQKFFSWPLPWSSKSSNSSSSWTCCTFWGPFCWPCESLLCWFGTCFCWKPWIITFCQSAYYYVQFLRSAWYTEVTLELTKAVSGLKQNSYDTARAGVIRCTLSLPVGFQATLRTSQIINSPAWMQTCCDDATHLTLMTKGLPCHFGRSLLESTSCTFDSVCVHNTAILHSSLDQEQNLHIRWAPKLSPSFLLLTPEAQSGIPENHQFWCCKAFDLTCTGLCSTQLNKFTQAGNPPSRSSFCLPCLCSVWKATDPGRNVIGSAILMDRDTTDDVEQELGLDRVKVKLLLLFLSTP